MASAMPTPEESNLRQLALQLAIGGASRDASPEAIVEAADIFLDFLLGNIEFKVEEPEVKAA